MSTNQATRSYMYGFTHYLATVYFPAMNSKKLVGVMSPAWNLLTSRTSVATPPMYDAQRGPGQRFAIAAMEVCDRVFARDSNVTIRWVPSHYRIQGNETADEFARVAAEGSASHRQDTPTTYWTRPPSPTCREPPPRPGPRPRQSGSPAALAPAGRGLLRGEAYATSTCAAPVTPCRQKSLTITRCQGAIHLCTR